MERPGERSERIEALRGLLERLGAPDLALVEAKALRDRLAALLERGESGALGLPIAGPLGRRDGPGPGHRGPRLMRPLIAATRGESPGAGGTHDSIRKGAGIGGSEPL